jgi:hypothetical protein
VDLGSYRREYAAYCSAVERERYEHHAGLKPAPDLARVNERYSDLWSREAVEDLKRKYDETGADFETERASVAALLAAARRRHVEARACEVTVELSRCDEAARVDWGGERIKARDASALLARETDAARRRELAARLLDASRACDDLRASRLEALAEASRALGLATLRALYEDASAAPLDTLAAQADKFLERTSDLYARHLAAWASAHAPRPGALTHADLPFFERAAHLERLLHAGGARAAYAEALAGLGVPADTQTNVRLDDAARAVTYARAACFGVAPPDDVRLVAGAERVGASAYVSFFFAGGRAQNFGWTSRETASRHPEFVRAADDSAREAAGFLFASLLRDGAWAAEHLPLRASDARELARALSLLELADARRSCARLRYALALDSSSDPRAESLAEVYVSTHTEATGFRHDPASRLADADEWFSAATRLRAHLLAASLREHLRSAHGRRWHASRPAGDELVDIWNTSARYHAEDLARLAWGGRLDFDLLAGDLEEALDVE